MPSNVPWRPQDGQRIDTVPAAKGLWESTPSPASPSMPFRGATCGRSPFYRSRAEVQLGAGLHRVVADPRELVRRPNEHRAVIGLLDRDHYVPVRVAVPRRQPREERTRRDVSLPVRAPPKLVECVVTDAFKLRADARTSALSQFLDVGDDIVQLTPAVPPVDRA